MKHLTAVLFFTVACSLGCSSKKCDPVALTGCDAGLTCETVSGGDPACFKPVLLQGRVFDLADDSAIAGALVVAINSNGSPISSVAESNADGTYSLQLPSERDEDGVPVDANATLRADAAGYQTFPSGLRQAIPLDASSSAEEDAEWVLESSLTDIGLIAQPDGTGTGSIHGTVETPEEHTGVLVVAETGSPAAGFSAIADRDGNYKIFNLSAGDYSVLGYTKGHNYDAEDATLADDEDLEINLSFNTEETALLTGSVQIVNAPGGATTSVILVVESTFNSTWVRGDAPPGLRAPDSGIDPNVSGTFTISGIPAGTYVVLAAFENDGLVRDPDQCIAGTDILHQEFAAGETVSLDGFKITEGLEVLSPGADEIETVTTATPTFSWVDDSSEDNYHVSVIDSFGNITWETDIAGVSGSDPEVTYAGPALESGQFYQFHVVSSKNSCELSQTEDLKGVFFVEL